MRKLAFVVTTLLGIFTLIFATQCASAQHSPVIGGKYTNEEILTMLKEHKMDHSKDTYPSQAIVDKFSADFPATRDVEWEKTERLYEVDFDIANRDYEAFYDMEGNLIMYKHDIKNSAVPAVVKNAALAKYANFRIEDADKIVCGTETIYKLELERGEQEVKVAVKSDGTLIEEYYYYY